MAGRDFEQIISEIEQNETDQIDKISEVVDSASPEELTALFELHDEDASEGPADTAKAENIDGEPDVKADLKAEELPGEDLAEVTKGPEVETKDVVPPENNGRVVITDDYISKADEKDRNILSAIKGEEVTPKMLQNYLNAQHQMGKLGTKLGEASKKTENEQGELKKAVPDEIPQQQLTQEVERLKETELLNRLRKTYKDLPEDPDEVNEYVNSLPQRDFYKYMEKEKSLKGEVDKDVNTALYYQNNQKQINETVMANDITRIVAELKESGIEDPAKFGLDLTLTTTPTGERQNALIQSLLIGPDGRSLDPTIVTFVGNIPILNEQALYNKFFTVNGKLVREIMRKQTSVESRKEAYKVLEGHEGAANNTASVSKGGGVTGSFGTKVRSVEDLDNLSPAEIKSLMASVDN